MTTSETAWLLEQIARDEQTARAMTHAIMHLQSRWSPGRLLTDCEARRRITIRHQPVADTELGDGLICRCCGYLGEWPVKWPCDTIRDVASVYADKPGFPPAWRP